MATATLARDVSDLQANLRTFTRLATTLRSESPRNLSQLEAVEREIDLTRKALGYGCTDFRCAGCVGCTPKEAA